MNENNNKSFIAYRNMLMKSNIEMKVNQQIESNNKMRLNKKKYNKAKGKSNTSACNRCYNHKVNKLGKIKMGMDHKNQRKIRSKIKFF